MLCAVYTGNCTACDDELDMDSKEARRALCKGCYGEVVHKNLPRVIGRSLLHPTTTRRFGGGVFEPA